MMQNNFNNLFSLESSSFMILLIIWSLFWKGLALWHSARKESSYWFIAFLLLNTLGILEIIYLFAILKLNFRNFFTK